MEYSRLYNYRNVNIIKPEEYNAYIMLPLLIYWANYVKLFIVYFPKKINNKTVKFVIWRRSEFCGKACILRVNIYGKQNLLKEIK